MNEAISDFPVVVRQSIEWGDMDAHGHINNVCFFRYIENARIAYYERIGKSAFEREAGVGFVIASLSCKYKAPLDYPDNITIGASVSEIGTDRMTMKYAIFSEKQGRLAATAEAIAVAFDQSENRKIEFSDELRKKIEDLEGRAL